MGFRRKLYWLILVLTPLLLLTGCGDLEPEMQDTRTVSLNIDFHGKSSSRSSSSVSAVELSQYNTHLILALPSWEYLTSSYKDFYSSFAQGLMNTADKKVSLEIPLNTEMILFAFLFKENYSMPELFSGTREVGYYGESQPFSIDAQTNNLSLGISLQSTDTTTGDGGGTDPDTDNDGEDTYDDEADADTDGDDNDGVDSDTGSDDGNDGGSEAAPAAPLISGVSSGTFTTSQTFTVSGESGATIEYSLDGGSIWNAYSAAVTLTSVGSYTITARQSVAGGNVSANATYITVVINQASPTCTVVNSCSSTPSGSFYVNNGTLSGIYDYFLILALTGEPGIDNSTGCVSSSTYISGRGPTGTQSLIIQEVITSSTTFATKDVYYSDTACSSEIASMVIGYDNVSVGDNVTGLTTSIGNKTYPSSASEVTYKESCMEVKGTTDDGRDYLNTLISSSFVTTGQTHTCQGSGESKHALWAADNSSESWESLHKEESSTAEYPGDWSSDTDSSTKLQSVTDIDGNLYRTVVIGDQNWMAENLKVTKYRNGDNITTNSDWYSNTSGAYGVYANDASNLDPYGLLYNWYAVGNSSGICPAGWHVATKDDYEDLISELGGNSVAVGKMKETGTDHWQSEPSDTSNSSGFTLLGNGFRGTTGSFSNIRRYSYTWTATPNGSPSAYYLSIGYNTNSAALNPVSKKYGFGVRCLED